jgi:hypothetical protein
LTNYFNYFTEIEEHFQRARGTSLFLLSPLDWALIESWKSSGVPLEAVLRGIDEAFEKWRTRRVKTQSVNSLAFCAQAVLTAAARTPESAASVEDEKKQAAPFPEDDVRAYLRSNATQLRTRPETAFSETAAALDALAAGPLDDLESLEQQLSVLEQKLVALARAAQTDEAALTMKRELEAQLKPWRSKMSAPQIAMLEQQYTERRLLEGLNLPRLSLFYLR